MSALQLTPSPERVLLRLEDELETKTAAGIIMVKLDHSKFRKATVRAIGADVETVAPGDRVLIRQYSVANNVVEVLDPDDVEGRSEVLLLLKAAEIEATVDGE